MKGKKLSIFLCGKINCADYLNSINPEAESIKTDETTSLQQRRRKSINQNRDSNRLSDSVTVVLPQSCCISEMDDLDDIPNQSEFIRRKEIVLNDLCF